MSAVLNPSPSTAPKVTRAPARGAWLTRPWVKPAIFVLSLLPFAWLFYGALANTLGANPAEALIRATGDWTLRFLCLTLAVTPLRVWSKQPALARFRRMLGLFSFFYAVLHFLCYAWLDMGLEWQAIVKDIPKRPFALVGFAALLLMTPLALTSFNRAIKALGAKRWQALHKSVYAVVLLGLLHFFWMKAAKNNFGEWSIYAVVVFALLGWRARWAFGRTMQDTERRSLLFAAKKAAGRFFLAAPILLAPIVLTALAAIPYGGGTGHWLIFAAWMVGGVALVWAISPVFRVVYDRSSNGARTSRAG